MIRPQEADGITMQPSVQGQHAALGCRHDTAQHSTAQHGTAQHALMLMSSAMQQGNHYSFHVSSLGLVAQAFSDTRLPNP